MKTFALVLCVAASACTNDAPSAPSLWRALQLDVPSVITLGAAPVAVRAQVEMTDGSVHDLSNLTCSWTTSDPAVATIVRGVIEGRSLGDATITLRCGDLQAEQVVRVRRRLTGTVIARDSNVPVPNAVVSIVSGPDAGAQARTDAAGRFTLFALATLDVQASAAEFDSVQLRVDAAESIELTLSPSIQTFRWEGSFDRSKRIPEGMLQGFEFETHHTAEVSLALSANCPTSGTYDDFHVSMEKDGKFVLGISPFRAFTVARVSKIVPPGAYRVLLNNTNAYASTGCPWQLELKRPH